MEHLAIDLGGRESQICVRSSEGTILDEQRWPTQDLQRYLVRRPQSVVIIETSAEAFAVAAAARECGHAVRIVPATLVKALGVGQRGIKTDRRDAQLLSESSCRMELPSVHVPSAQAQERKARCTAREALVTARTLLVNSVRGYLRTILERVAAGRTETFPQRVRARLRARPAGVPEFLAGLLTALDSLNEMIAAADRELKELATGDEECRRLMTVPGVGPVTAVRFVSAVDQVGRFATAHQLESYLGLTPGEDSSGARERRTGITKAGSARVRWALVQAAWCATRTRPHDPLARWTAGVMQRRGRCVGIVAAARKLAGILYAMWRDQTGYEPRRAAAATQAAAPPPTNNRRRAAVHG
jgi:transposase